MKNSALKFHEIINRRIKTIEKIIYNTCNHNWEKDWDDPYSRYKVCSKCKLANMPYVYNS